MIANWIVDCGLQMLTGDEAVTRGNAYVGGHSILTELQQARQNLGYCPQEDALLSLLTGTEHLQLFARLRGIPNSFIEMVRSYFTCCLLINLFNCSSGSSFSVPQVVSDSLSKLSLIPYKDRCAGTYSGGNKRKLSTALAMIGTPSVVFLVTLVAASYYYYYYYSKSLD